MVVVEQLYQGQPAPNNCNGAQKFQSLSYSAISLQSDDDNAGVTGLSELSSPDNGHGANGMACNELKNCEHLHSNHGYWGSQSMHDNSRSEDSSFSPVLTSGLSHERIDFCPANEKQQTRHQHVRRLEQAVNHLESQLDEIESSHGSFEVLTYYYQNLLKHDFVPQSSKDDKLGCHLSPSFLH